MNALVLEVHVGLPKSAEYHDTSIERQHQNVPADALHVPKSLSSIRGFLTDEDVEWLNALVAEGRGR